jgi:acyl carrier protein
MGRGNSMAQSTPTGRQEGATAHRPEVGFEPPLAERVRQAFVDALELPADANIEALEIGADPHWDSVGHMALVSELESRFGIMLETDDMIDMSSYVKALEILRRYGVDV